MFVTIKNAISDFGLTQTVFILCRNRVFSIASIVINLQLPIRSGHLPAASERRHVPRETARIPQRRQDDQRRLPRLQGEKTEGEKELKGRKHHISVGKAILLWQEMNHCGNSF